MIRLVFERCAKPLYKIFTSFMEKEVFPLNRKMPKVVPIHKKESKHINTITDMFRYYQFMKKISNG